MKKKILLFLLVSCILMPLSASWEWDNGCSLELVSIDPVFRESRADPFAHATSFGYMTQIRDRELYPMTVLVADSTMNGGNGGYREVPFTRYRDDSYSYFHLRGGANLGLLRFRYRDIVDTGLYFHGGLNTVFNAKHGADVLGFDGMYGIGLDMKLFDILSVRFGMHHFSGHWGDEMLKEFRWENPTEFAKLGGDYRLLEYVRNDSYLLSLSVEPVRYFRVLAEFELPMKRSWFRPAAHIPQNTMTPGQDTMQSQKIGNEENVTRTTPYPDSYRAWRIGFGAEAIYPVKNVGNLFIAYDLQMHQDGQIDLAKMRYDENRPWDIEHTVTAGFEFEKTPEDPSFAVQLSYHDGRFPLLNFFYQKSRYFAFELTAAF